MNADARHQTLRCSVLLSSCLAALLIVAACTTPPRPSISDDPFHESDLRSAMICTDSTGLASEGPAALCQPCLLPNATAQQSLYHGRRLAALIRDAATANSQYAECIRRAYRNAIAAGQGGMPVRAELAVFDLFSLNPLHRAHAINVVDASVDSLLLLGDSVSAAAILEILGNGVWDRALRLLARSLEVRIAKEELEVHDVGARFMALKHVPSAPAPSQALGESETAWARAIFESAAALVPRREAIRSRLTRLALASFVVREQWSELDSAAREVLRRFPRDSVAPVARALARFRQIHYPVAEYPGSMALFDSALRALPRVDSADYDDFDEILSTMDDAWRNEHLLGDRVRLDTRAWKLFDPIWLTPVNEIHLVRRARMAEANFRYAHLASAGQSGSDTPLGVVLLRRAVPSPRWAATPEKDGTERRWPGGFRTAIMVPPESFGWTAFYRDNLLLENRIMLPLPPGRDCGDALLLRSLYQCARGDNASWHDVPFENTQDTIDVAAARFRVSDDSVDMYLGARIPMRRFPHARQDGTAASDSIIVGATIATPMGDHLFETREGLSLPAKSTIASTAQWHARLPVGDMMHRIEAYEPRLMGSARGTRQLTSTGAATFMTSGFAMSDVLVAASIEAQRTPPRSWRDLRTVPNGGVVSPRGDVAMAWEIYGLTRGSNGRSRWQVTLSREDGRAVVNMNMRSLIVGNPDAGVKVVANEPGAAMVRYMRTEPASPVMVEHIRFRMPDIGEGHHVLRVRIQDLETNRIVQRSVSVRVLDEKDQAR